MRIVGCNVNARSRLVLFMLLMLWCLQSLLPSILVSMSAPASMVSPSARCADTDLNSVITQLDQCNSVLVGTCVYLQDWLWYMLGLSTHAECQNLEHTTPLLRELYCVCVPERIQFQLCVLVYHCVHSTAPAYLSDSLRPTSEIVASCCLHSADTTTL